MNDRQRSAKPVEERMDQAAARDRPAATAFGPEMLATGVLVIRWALVAWMIVLALSSAPDLPPAPLRTVVLALAVALTAVHTVRRPAWSWPLLLADLAVTIVVAVTGIRYASLATVYPVTTALHWGAARGVGGGMFAAGAVGAALISARLRTNPLPDASGLAFVMRMATDAVNMSLAGGGLGYVATLLRRSASKLDDAQAAEVAARERAARLTERESLGRQIHDSVLQVLTLVHKRGRELAEQESVPGPEVARLAELAAAQERTLRSLILRSPDEPAATGAAVSLRAALESAAEQIDEPPDVQVTAVGESMLPAGQARQVRAAVEQALQNVVDHADARHAWVFIDEEDSDIVVTVRDDGRGFVYDEAHLRASGKYGLLRSIRGRVTELGGTTRIRTAPGTGTELELRLPRAGSSQPEGEGGTVERSGHD